MKKVFLKISQNLQENTCARVSFLIKLQAFPINFVKFLRTPFLTEHPGGCFCWYYAADLQGEHPMPKSDFNKVALQLYWNRTGMSVLLQIYCISSEQLFARTPMEGLHPRISQTYKEKNCDITAIDSKKTDRGGRFSLLSASLNLESFASNWKNH